MTTRRGFIQRLAAALAVVAMTPQEVGACYSFGESGPEYVMPAPDGDTTALIYAALKEYEERHKVWFTDEEIAAVCRLIVGASKATTMVDGEGTGDA